MSKVYSIIPARGGSKGVPGKNIKNLKDFPLLAYSIGASLMASKINRTIISTDSEEIASIAVKYGAEVPFFRPAEISGDKSSDYEFFNHAIKWFQDNEGIVPDFFVHLRPTTPIRNPEMIDNAINLFESQTEATSLRSVHEMSESAYKYFEIGDTYLRTVFYNSYELDAANSARQAFPKTYVPNGYVDVINTDFVINHKKIHGNKVLPFVTEVTHEVDTIADFDLIEYYMNKSEYSLNVLKGDK